MGQKLWISANSKKKNHYDITHCKEMLLSEHAISSMLIDKTISERETDDFLAWILKSLRTGQIKLEHDFHLISDYVNTKHIQAKCDAINSTVWKKPNKKYTLAQLPPEFQKVCLDIYRKKGMSNYAVHDVINSRINATLMRSAIRLLVKNDIITPVPIMEQDYTEYIPNKYMFTQAGAEEIIALKGKLAKAVPLTITPTAKLVPKKRASVSKRVVEYIDSLF